MNDVDVYQTAQINKSVCKQIKSVLLCVTSVFINTCVPFYVLRHANCQTPAF